jgi:hypothetical protein
MELILELNNMKIQELIDELSKIRDKDPEKDIVIEVFDTKKSRITRGWIFDLVIEDAREHVKLRQNKYRGWNLYTESTKQIEEIEEKK